jgi:hypothetical protein
VVTVLDEDMADISGCRGDRNYRKTMAKKRMGGVCDLDFGEGLMGWLLEQGTLLGSRLKASNP